MKKTRNAVGLLALGALVYAAGHLQILSAPTALAWTGGDDDKAALSADMVAAMKCGMPGQHHEPLGSLVGDFKGEFKIWMAPDQPPVISTGTVTREWVLDGRFVRETVEATTDFGTFTGIGYIGYNNFDGQYEFVWLESMSTAISTSSGRLDPDTGVLTILGSQRDPASGRVVNSRGLMDLSSPDRQVYTGYAIGPDGREHKSFEGITVRQ